MIRLYTGYPVAIDVYNNSITLILMKGKEIPFILIKFKRVGKNFNSIQKMYMSQRKRILGL